jgi:EAL domain-containing protein (putative c-di-GMP-specific phosphodiesterase class I)
VPRETAVEIARQSGELQWVARLHQAFDDNRFRLYFQHIVPLAARAGEAGCELLVRLEDEDGRIVPPMAFLPAAERYGLMPALDRWVIGTALAWLAGQPRAAGLFLNLSGQSLAEDGFLDFVVERFRATAAAPERVCFEITETSAIANWNRARHVLGALRERGCRFALDDFGSGMSSFAYLKNLPVDYIKIDGAFVRDMATDPMDRAVIESIHRIAHVMGIETIAEHVENGETRARLLEIGVDYAQGFGIHTPEPLC